MCFLCDKSLRALPRYGANLIPNNRLQYEISDEYERYGDNSPSTNRFIGEKNVKSIKCASYNFLLNKYVLMLETCVR